MFVTAFEVAQRFVGVKETAGATSTPAVLAMLRLDDASVPNDATPWCSAFINWIAWILRLPRSKSLAARSWLQVGRPIDLHDARAAFDVVIFSRGSGPQPGPNVIAAPGHVAFYAGMQDDRTVLVLGGNQGDAVSVAGFPVTSVIGVRRLSEGD